MYILTCESPQWNHKCHVINTFFSFLQSRAKQLYNAGYKTLTHLANADPAVLAQTIEHLYKKQANQIVASAKVSAAFTCHFFIVKVLDNNWHVNRLSIRWPFSVFQMLVNEKAAALQEEVDDLLKIPLDLPMPSKTELVWVYLLEFYSLYECIFIIAQVVCHAYIIKIMYQKV